MTIFGTVNYTPKYSQIRHLGPKYGQWYPRKDLARYSSEADKDYSIGDVNEDDIDDGFDDNDGDDCDDGVDNNNDDDNDDAKVSGKCARVPAGPGN